VSVSVRPTRGERTRARLLDAARTAFAGVSWSRARVEDVCRTAGVGHGTYYAYFANKTAILEALVHQHAADLYRLVEAPWTSGVGEPDLRADVRRVIAGFVEVAERDRDVRDIWFSAAPAEPTLAALVEEVRRQFVARVRVNLEAARDARRTRPELDVEVAAAALAAMVEHTVALALAGAGPTGDGEAARLVDGLTDLWVAAVYQ
jgi:AcrR family transcriptional regulator